GLGIGARLVEETLRFAREARYRKVTLWTHSVLTAARRIYERAGFKLVATKEHDEFGKTLVGETCELDLGQQSWQASCDCPSHVRRRHPISTSSARWATVTASFWRRRPAR